MNQSKKIPRIQSISKMEDFRVHCVFNTGEYGVIDCKKLFEEWDVSPDDYEYRLLDLKEFQKVKLRDGVLSWENVSVEVTYDDDRVTINNAPYEIDPITIHQHAVMIPEEKSKNSVLDIKDAILIRIAQLKDKEQLQKLLLFIDQQLVGEKGEYFS